MPKGTKVDMVYEALVGKGMTKGKAAAIAQSKTHQSLATGKKKTKEGKPVGFPKKGKGKKAR